MGFQRDKNCKKAQKNGVNLDYYSFIRTFAREVDE